MENTKSTTTTNHGCYDKKRKVYYVPSEDIVFETLQQQQPIHQNNANKPIIAFEKYPKYSNRTMTLQQHNNTTYDDNTAAAAEVSIVTDCHFIELSKKYIQLKTELKLIKAQLTLALNQTFRQHPQHTKNYNSIDNDQKTIARFDVIDKQLTQQKMKLLEQKKQNIMNNSEYDATTTTITEPSLNNTSSSLKQHIHDTRKYLKNASYQKDAINGDIPIYYNNIPEPEQNNSSSSILMDPTQQQRGSINHDIIINEYRKHNDDIFKQHYTEYQDMVQSFFHQKHNTSEPPPPTITQQLITQSSHNRSSCRLTKRKQHIAAPPAAAAASMHSLFPV